MYNNTQTQKTNLIDNKLKQQSRLELLTHFIKEHKNQLVADMDHGNIKATVVPSSPQYLPYLGELIRNGKLVGFPTQTVYGLGADATNQSALLQIYQVKRRPLTDPIIVHVLDSQQALSLVLPDSQKQLDLFKKLTNKFWPGPLTVILKANLDILPKVVTAQTGFVGIRSPKCKYARQLIKASERPIGAPSANLFSHVSPTSAVHVFNDFYDQQVTVVNGQKCQYGVQSTVVKILNNNLQILREGSLSTKKLEQYVKSQFGDNIKISVKKRVQKQQNQNMQAPGQLLKHYSPFLPCYLTSLQKLVQSKEQLVQNQQQAKIKFRDIAFISFCEQFSKFKDKFKFYLNVQDLSEQQIKNQQEQEQKFCTVDQKKRMRSLYHLLRKAQNLEVKLILIGWNEQKQGTLWDKIFRSTQGIEAYLL